MSQFVHCLECGKSWTQIVPIEKTTIGTNVVVTVALSGCWQHREKPTPKDFRAIADELAEALKDARHTHWWIKTNVSDGCKSQTCDGCKIEIHEAVYMAKTRLPEIDAALAKYRDAIK